MGRLLVLLFVYLGAYLVLRRLLPVVTRGWRHGVLVGLSVFAFAAWTVPAVTGYGLHHTPPALVPVKLFAVVWSIAALLVMLMGPPFLILKLRAERRKQAAPPGVDLERRSLLVKAGQAMPVLAIGASGVGVVGGSLGFTVREVEVKLRGLPAALDGFRIGQITDVHVGPFISPEYLRGAVEVMNTAGVDLQVMTGDLIDDVNQVDETMAALASTTARHGMLAVLGNHEHWRGLDEVLGGYAQLAERGAPVRLLVDEAHVLEHGGQRVRVVGVDYPMSGPSRAGRDRRWQRSAETAFKDGNPDDVVLCLSHHPDFFPYAAERGARLTLAGHTHGGQVAFLGVPLFGFAFKHMLGRYRFRDHHLYVSGGTGHWLPFRIGVPPEVTLLTLRSA
ncbi:serine/threonine protein phosphatase [Corallococcus coralloides DSM 2259]|uniref:Serine/threonine protein phosphatase n=1 Tax=Corallococcus coralloides (strain ATCC 25202 / DSM 2259 / NBRC 100086 / M2) TaxID=1144275 RepID=H8MFR6_CORCM|nr:metallophosphoesterase [Corallococcus coralloides]AFE10681.1 serine/threonine protein phosphatase [Corallococcus coralloides DSM 2259]